MTDDVRLPDDIVDRSGAGGKIVLVVLDGIGGLPDPETGRTELETARTPNLDALARGASLGMSIPVAPGVTPGSGPGHLSLFGYDPVRHVIGRGALSALGVGFDLEPGDVAIRLNLASLDPKGRVSDRRAGRPDDAEGSRVVEKVKGALVLPDGVRAFLLHEKEHRAVLVLRGPDLAADLADTDPQTTGVEPLPVRALSPGSERTAGLLRSILETAREVLRDEPAVHTFLARGYAAYQGLPGIEERFGLKGAAVARYPMYRGVARLVGMDVAGEPESDEEAITLLERVQPEYDFTFFHFKATDSRGEDGDFAAKVAAIETADALVRRIVTLEPEVLIVTGDHSTPARYGAHTWHSVPVLLASEWARPTGDAFGESTCRAGDLGTFEARHLMSLALAHAGRLAKFGA
jgi:2,3-bisphosphoglycerate-independent phosphoglycerate mutase